MSPSGGLNTGTGQITISNQCCTYSDAVAVYSRTEAMVEALDVP
jgi:hypothetical protein